MEKNKEPSFPVKRMGRDTLEAVKLETNVFHGFYVLGTASVVWSNCSGTRSDRLK